MEMTGNLTTEEMISVIGDRVIMQSINMIAESEDMEDGSKLNAIKELIKVSSIAKDHS